MNHDTSLETERARKMRLYPDVFQAGGLAAAVLADKRLADERVRIVPGFPNVHGYGTLADDDKRTVQIVCAARDREFLVSFTEGGVIFAKMDLADLDDVRNVVRVWLVDKADLARFQQLCPGLVATPQGLACEEGRGLDFQWETFLAAPDPAIRLFAEAAAQNAELRRLFPFRSGNTFRLSRSSGWPYDFDYPYVRFTSAGTYQVMAAAPTLTFPEALTQGTILFEGSIAEVVVRLAQEICEFD